MNDKTTTVTVKHNHGISPGDFLAITTTRHGFLEKSLAFLIGVIYYRHLPRPLNQFIKTKIEKMTVTSVSGTTLDVE